MDPLSFVDEELARLGSEGLLRKLRNVKPLSSREVLVDGRSCLNFSSNDYLGLAWRPELKAGAARWMDDLGAGAGGSRLVTGNFAAYQELERRIAAWKRAEAALLFGSGYLANAGCLQAIADRNSVIFADKLNHASLIAGCKLSGADFKRFAHKDYGQLAEMLGKAGPRKRKVIASDTVFSMDGDVADVAALKEVAERNGALLYLDDAHATGVFGENGEGLADGRAATIVMGTFSKAMGSYGAYVACSARMRDYLVNSCWSFIFTTALPPQVCGAVAAALDLTLSEEFKTVRASYLKKVQALTAELMTRGFDTGDTSTQIIPLMVGEPEAAVRIARTLLEEGILAVAIRPPTVPHGTSRIRINPTAAHTVDDIHRLTAALAKVCGSFLGK